MKINQTETAIASYYSIDESHFTNEERRALMFLTAPQTISILCKSTGIEKSSMSRVLNTLYHKKGTIRISHIGPCPISGKTVQWYCIIGKQLTLF